MTTITEIPTSYDLYTERLARTDGGRTYYAVSWPYGQGVTTGDHPHVHAACNPIAFASAAERDAWVEAKTGREAVTLTGLPSGWSRAKFVAAALEANGAACD